MPITNGTWFLIQNITGIGGRRLGNGIPPRSAMNIYASPGSQVGRRERDRAERDRFARAQLYAYRDGDAYPRHTTAALCWWARPRQHPRPRCSPHPTPFPKPSSVYAAAIPGGLGKAPGCVWVFCLDGAILDHPGTEAIGAPLYYRQIAA